MLSNKCGKRRNTYFSNYVVFDLETTGVSCNTDAVVEISAVKVENGAVVGEYSTLVNPGRSIPHYATEVNGITDEMVKDSPDFEEALSGFLDFAGDAVLVGHNIHAFDMKFIYRDAERFWGKTIGNDYVDTLQVARAYLPQLRHHKLTDLAEHYGIGTEGAHRALNDCRMNQQIYEMLGKEMSNPSKEAKAVRKCPRCGNILRKRSGRYGEFFGCSGYPECRYTENI